jgi:very-short-patch-repair endonuclease
VSDARGALDAFEQLGFKQAIEPLLNDDATHTALSRLVTDDLSWLGMEDSLVLFFAGHGHTRTREYSDGHPTRRGYIIPIDAPAEGTVNWLRLDHWLSEVAHLPPKHILVILDSCYSGIALDRVAARPRDIDAPVDGAGGWHPGTGSPLGDARQHHDAEAPFPSALEYLSARRSRRVITSALHNQQALDNGPHPDHSLFTGCLIEALTGRFVAENNRSLVTGTEIGMYLQKQVRAYARGQQIPDFGELELDNRGELIVQLPDLGPKSGRGSSKKPSAGGRGLKPKPRKGPRRPDPIREPDPSRPYSVRDDAVLDLGTDSAALDPAFVAALDRHAAERSRGASVLSVVAGESTSALAGWAEWAAGHGYLTLVTEGASFNMAISDILAQIPWLRCVKAARASLAAATGYEVESIDAALDARSGRERKAWINSFAALDPYARVSGWLLSVLRDPHIGVPDVATAPVQGGELMAILCRLAAPIAVLVHHPEPTAPWLERAITTGAALVTYLPDHAVAVGAPTGLVAAVLGTDRQSAAFSMARQGVVHIAPRAEGSAIRARHRAMRALHDALSRDSRTAGQFESDTEVPYGSDGPPIEVALVARSARLVVEIDSWYHFRDPQGYQAARITDARLQRAGYFVIRFPAEDVGERLMSIVEEIAVAFRGRRGSSFPLGETL